MIKKGIAKNIFLIGFMGSGKTRVGELIAKKLGLSFCDLDQVVEKEFGSTITEIFEKHGEDYFREIETRTLKNVAKKSSQIVSTGGGIVLKGENWDVMNRDGVTIYLRAPFKVLWERIEANTSRPLLHVENPFIRMKELLTIRVPLYEKAEIIVDTVNLSPENAAEEVIQRLSNLDLS